MTKCPFCQFQNEDGALFCEQCKTDLGVITSVALPLEVAPLPVTAAPEAVPVASVVSEAAPPLAEAVFEGAALAGSIPVAAVPVAEVTPPPAAAEPTSPSLGYASPTVGDLAPQPAAAVAPEAHSGALQTMSPGGASTQAAVPPSSPTFAPLPAGTQPKLVVLRGLKINTEYPLYEGHNFIGRADEKPVDIDLEDQESPDRIWSSRQHALITFEEGMLYIEDLNSSNGTFVNRTRVYPGQRRQLQVNDVIQIGTVQMKVKA